MYKVRTAKRQFRGSCGHQIEPGDRFVVEEPRPSFHCAACAKRKVETAREELLAELSSKPKPAAEAAR
jgi:threonine dehydrogenase-like Zn-dependent dehydrogenase